MSNASHNNFPGRKHRKNKKHLGRVLRIRPRFNLWYPRRQIERNHHNNRIPGLLVPDQNPHNDQRRPHFFQQLARGLPSIDPLQIHQFQDQHTRQVHV